MALGQHLVRELGLAESTDTLARWLVHEIAEAMTVAADAGTTRKRAAGRREVLHLITTLWDHRTRLPQGAYPLAPLREILGAISLFTKDDTSAWWGHRRNDDVETMVFRAFTMLMPCLLMLHAPDVHEVPGPGSAAYANLERDEQAILDAVGDWLARRSPPRPDAVIRPRVVFEGTDDDDRTEGEARESSEDDGSPAGDPEAALRLSALSAVAMLERGLAQIRARLEAPKLVDS